MRQFSAKSTIKKLATTKSNAGSRPPQVIGICAPTI